MFSIEINQATNFQEKMLKKIKYVINRYQITTSLLIFKAEQGNIPNVQKGSI